MEFFVVFVLFAFVVVADIFLLPLLLPFRHAIFTAFPLARSPLLGLLIAVF